MHRKFKNPKMPYIFNKILVLYFICDKCGSINDAIFKKEGSIVILKIIGLIDNIFCQM